MRRLAPLAVSLLFPGWAFLGHAQIITDFGSDELSSPAHTFEVTIGSDSTIFTGLDNQGAYFVLNASVSIQSTTTALMLTGIYNGTSAEPFVIALYDDADHEADYTGIWSDFIPGIESTAIIMPEAVPTDFTFNITGFTIASGGSGSHSVSFTAYSLAAVPEPSISGLLIFAAGALVGLRRGKDRSPSGLPC